MLAGRLFHVAGPATKKALDPSFFLVLDTSKCPSVADRRLSIFAMQAWHNVPVRRAGSHS